ncbi:MAG: hypothetical protein D4S01_05955 [Dehalococcoidia bacterium]|nr:MAG: hypothetical protein D4S01_05955 [Dehalococcoidia bacterium]
MIVTMDFDLNLKLPGADDTEKEYPDANMKVVDSYLKHMKRGHDVYIVTSRSYNRQSIVEIMNFLDKYKLKAKDIHHTNGDLKVATLERLGSQLHYDDDPEEIKAAEAVGIKTVYTFNKEAEEAYNRWFSSL